MIGWTFVFDLDGTLVDSAPDLADATNHVMSTLGIAPVDDAEIMPFVGHGALAMIENVSKAHGVVLLEPDLYKLFDVFIDYYTANIAVRSRPYPYLVETLTTLAQQGATLAVCTNKLEAQARALLDALDLTRHFSAITGRDTLAFHKPDPRHLTGTIELAKGDPKRAVMIGDSETDISTGKAAGIPVVAVTFGYSVVPVETFEPDVVIDSYRSLPAAIAKVQSAAATG